MSDITDERMATALERIADALERAHPATPFIEWEAPAGPSRPPDRSWVAFAEGGRKAGRRKWLAEMAREVTHAAWDDCERPADPLDESDHRPRHDRDGAHVYRHGPSHWHYYGLEDGACDAEVSGDDPVTLAHYNDHSGPLTFCGCPDDAIIEAENGATD